MTWKIMKKFSTFNQLKLKNQNKSLEFISDFFLFTPCRFKN